MAQDKDMHEEANAEQTEHEQRDSEAVKAYASVSESSEPDVESAEPDTGGEEATDSAAQARIEKLEADLNNHREALLRARAEFDNAQKRAAREVEKAERFALEKFLKELLPVKDSLEAGLDNKDNADAEKMAEGMELTLKMLERLMGEHNIEIIDPQGETFNPEWHEAMSMVPSPDHKPDTVVQVFQKGYLLNGRLVRPARVIVASEPG